MGEFYEKEGRGFSITIDQTAPLVRKIGIGALNSSELQKHPQRFDLEYVETSYQPMNGGRNFPI
ncbi:MAG: hypothetical protein AMJ42_02835 [Deltaproteobacteria bacterium DG_8]|nr:MAG: hypothetical protein AMJ42_02835 [Deltaproteobacteria bacterium DG_8]